MTATRANAFGDLSDFQPRPATQRKVDPAQIEQVARENKFPSRQAAAVTQPQPHATRRHTTGRNQQLNIKATSATIERFYRLADARKVVLGELLELALDALEHSAHSP